MKLLKQNGPYCLVFSAAMILDATPEELHAEIGTNGTEIWWPENHMRGIHIQEIQDCFLRRGKCLFPVELNPLLAPSETFVARECYKPEIRLSRFKMEIRLKRAILIANGHAVAWDGTMVYDPKGFVKSLDDYNIHEAWVMGQI